ncbi:MAG: DinB family protein [Acidobacteriia bacterium]|nr:DinB family protein [Terriglobia bacterium]
MTEIERIADQLRRAHEGEAWHGPALNETLKGVTAEAAARRPIASAHSIWEIVLHVGVWESVVRRRLSGEVIGDLPPEQDWPPVGETSEAAWKQARAALDRAHAELQKALTRLTDRQLIEAVPGPEYTAYYMLHGTVQHALYHAGQIALLKKAATA